METADATSVPYQLEALIVTAFTAARDRGKPEWRRMTTAVLKNRLLQFSRHEFSERKHGASSFRELLARYPTLVHVEGDSVELLAKVADAPVAQGGARQRIRADLWEAIVNFRGGKRYTWDSVEGRAREAREGENVVLPTLTESEMGAWRAEFALAHMPQHDLGQWRDDALGTKDLPAGLRAEWNTFVSSHVSSRLNEWFTKSGLEAPRIIVAASPPREIVDDSIERLREIVAACVAVMTPDELAAVQLPPAAVLRARLAGRL